MPVGASRDEVPPKYNSESLAGIALEPEHGHEVEENPQSAPDTRVEVASLERVASPEEELKMMTDGFFLHSATLSRRPRSQPVIHHLDVNNRKLSCTLADQARLSFNRNGSQTSVEGTLATRPMFVGFLWAENAAVPERSIKKAFASHAATLAMGAATSDFKVVNKAADSNSALIQAVK